MITTQSETIGHTLGLILIDCWEPMSFRDETSESNLLKIRRQHAWLGHMVTMLESLKFESVINACYMNRLVYDGPGSSQDSSIFNTISRYSWEQDSRNDTIVFNLIKHSRGRNDTSKRLKATVLNNEHSFMLLELDDFTWHWEYCLEKQINDWLVIGQSWQVCLHDRPIGFRGLKSLSLIYGINFYTAEWGNLHPDGSTVTEKDFIEDDLTWARVSDFGYKLIA